MEELKSNVKDQKKPHQKGTKVVWFSVLKYINRPNVLVITRCVWSTLTTLDYGRCFCDVFMSFSFIRSFIFRILSVFFFFPPSPSVLLTIFILIGLN